MLATLLLCAALAPLGAATARPPVVIGHLASLTGGNPGGVDNQLGAEQAAEEINAAGGLLGGRRLALSTEDDRTNPDAAVAGFRRLAAARVSAVAGSSFSNASLAVIPEAEAAGIAYVSTGAAEAQVEPVRPHVFMTPLSGRLVGEQLLRFMQGSGVARIAVAYDVDSAFARAGWASQKAILGRYGIEAVAEQGMPMHAADFSAAVRAVDVPGAQAVMVWATGPAAIGFARDYAAHKGALPLYMSHGAASPDFITALGAAAEGITVATSWATVASQLPEPGMRRAAEAFAVPFEKAHGRPPSQFAVDGYVSVRLIAAAIEAAGTDEPRAVRNALEHLTLLTPQGLYRYSPTDHAGLGIDAVAITAVRGGRFTLTGWSKARMAAPAGATPP